MPTGWERPTRNGEKTQLDGNQVPLLCEKVPFGHDGPFPGLHLAEDFLNLVMVVFSTIISENPAFHFIETVAGDSLSRGVPGEDSAVVVGWRE